MEIDNKPSKSGSDSDTSVELPRSAKRLRELSPLPSTDSGSSFRVPSSGFPLLSEDRDLSANEVLKESLRLQCINDASLANDIVQKYSHGATVDGFCRLSSLAPTKVGGYIQVSHNGANKFATLEEVMIWAGGRDLPGGQQASHRCCRPSCTIVSHVIPESAEVNNRRKNCLVFGDCHHCSLKILVCSHDPCCIKYSPGFTSWEDFLQNGVCGRVTFG